jgi:hypothetical protein
MPRYAFLEESIFCPHCGTQVTDVLGFQWGYCTSSSPIPEDYYHIGDSIRWRSCVDSTTPSWVYFSDKPFVTGNIGDPAVRDVFVQDGWGFFWDPDIEAVLYDPHHPSEQQNPGIVYYTGGKPPNQPETCHACQGILPGAMIEIRDNIIKRAWIYTLGEFDPNTDIYIIASDGTLISKKEWNDHPMGRKERC